MRRCSTYTTLTLELRTLAVNSCIKNSTRAQATCTKILPEARGNHRNNERSERLIHALLPLQLVHLSMLCPTPRVLGLTRGEGGVFVLKLLPQGWGNCIITWGLGVGLTSGVGRGFDMLMWPQGWGLCNRKYGKSPPFPHISPRMGGGGWGITLIGALTKCLSVFVMR